MWIRKKQWKLALEKILTIEFRIKNLGLKVVRLESLLNEELKETEGELSEFIDFVCEIEDLQISQDHHLTS